MVFGALCCSDDYRHIALPVPTVFVVGTDGVVRFRYVNPIHRVRLDVDGLLAAAKNEVS